ncbi:hypothetical protein [Mycobacterium tilburgii]|nr:hypothetical protein [Mycobacterium tilburgii]
MSVAFLGATLSRFFIAPVFVLVAAVVAVILLIFQFGRPRVRVAAAEDV